MEHVSRHDVCNHHGVQYMAQLLARGSHVKGGYNCKHNFVRTDRCKSISLLYYKVVVPDQSPNGVYSSDDHHFNPESP